MHVNFFDRVIGHRLESPDLANQERVLQELHQGTLYRDLYAAETHRYLCTLLKQKMSDYVRYSFRFVLTSFALYRVSSISRSMASFTRMRIPFCSTNFSMLVLKSASLP